MRLHTLHMCLYSWDTHSVGRRRMLEWPAIPIFPGLKAFQGAKIRKVLSKPGQSCPLYKQWALQFCLLFMSFGPKLGKKACFGFPANFNLLARKYKVALSGFPCGHLRFPWETPEKPLFHQLWVYFLEIVDNSIRAFLNLATAPKISSCLPLPISFGLLIMIWINIPLFNSVTRPPSHKNHLFSHEFPRWSQSVSLPLQPQLHSLLGLCLHWPVAFRIACLQDPLRLLWVFLKALSVCWGPAHILQYNWSWSAASEGFHPSILVY